MTDSERIAFLEKELGRAYRAIRGFYSAAKNKTLPDDVVLSYHAPTIGAANRFVYEESLEGSEFFIGKSVDVLHEALKM